MKLHERDLRKERSTYEPRLPSSLKLAVIGFYIASCVGLTAIAANALQYWNHERAIHALQQDKGKASSQQAMLESVTVEFNKRQALVADIQAWLDQRCALDAVYHQCAQVVPRGTLVSSLSLRHDPQRSALQLKVGVEGSSQSYNNLFRSFTGFFTTAPGMKVADIRMDPRPNGASMEIDVLLEDHVQSISSLTHHDS